MGNDLKTTEGKTMQTALIELASREDVDTNKLKELIELQERMEDKQAKKLFQSALAGFQKDCPIIKRIKKVDFKAKSGNHTKYDYAPLDEIVHIIKPVLARYELSFTFDIANPIEKQSTIITTIYHSSGYEKDFTYFFNPLHDDTRMNQSQRAKSAVTYAKRAALENALGIVTAGEDDDAKRAIDTPVTSEQVDTINSLCNYTDTPPEALYKYLRIESISDLSQTEADNAIKSLKQKRKALVKKGATNV